MNLNFAKVLSVILTSHKIELKDLKDIRQIKLEEQIGILFKVVDKLEQRIATLEKVLQSHAKCIGEIREVITDE